MAWWTDGRAMVRRTCNKVIWRSGRMMVGNGEKTIFVNPVCKSRLCKIWVSLIVMVISSIYHPSQPLPSPPPPPHYHHHHPYHNHHHHHHHNRQRYHIIIIILFYLFHHHTYGNNRNNNETVISRKDKDFTRRSDNFLHCPGI